MRFNTSFALFILVYSSTVFSAGWGMPESEGHDDWSDYTEASPDIHPDAWLVSKLADFEGHEIQLRSSDGALLRWISVDHIKELHRVHVKMQQVSETPTALYITRGDQPNASAGLRQGQNTVFVNFGMFDLIDGEPNLWAALMGHEIAHLKLKHGEKQAKKALPMTILKSIGSAVIANPLANLASSTLLDSVTAKFSRDDERQSDYMGVIWAIEANYEANGAARLHQRMSETSKGHPIPFMSSHPSGKARVKELQALADRLSSDPAATKSEGAT